MNIVVVDYGVGNLGAIPNMLARLGESATVTADDAAIEIADRIILPGVGAYGAGMASLHARGLLPVLARRVLSDKVPTLGLCLGMQLLFERSEEGSVSGLGWLKGEVIHFRPTGAAKELPIPHMGWSELDIRQESVLLGGLGDHPRYYFAHAYHAQPADPHDLVAIATYRYPFAAVVQRENIFGAQFHPEKSHRFGLKLLSNFIGLG